MQSKIVRISQKLHLACPKIFFLTLFGPISGTGQFCLTVSKLRLEEWGKWAKKILQRHSCIAI